jgi:hypothetical protein
MTITVVVVREETMATWRIKYPDVIVDQDVGPVATVPSV